MYPSVCAAASTLLALLVKRCNSFCRASKWKSAVIISRLEDTLKWRRSYGIDASSPECIVTAAHVEPEAVTGKQILFGYDKGGRPALYLLPSRQNTDVPERQIQYTFWMIERAIDLMEPGVETLSLLINFADRAKNPSLGTARAVLNILQTHYPERLGIALIINIPFLVSAFFKVIMNFVDPVTREKVKFNPSALSDGYFDADLLMKEWWGGNRDFEYVHDSYWADLVAKTDARRAAWMAKWTELGAKVGISEWDYKSAAAESEPVKETAVEETIDDKTIVEPKAAESAESQKKVGTGHPTQTEAVVASVTTGTVAVSGAGAVAGTAGGAASGEGSAGGAAGGGGGGDE